MNIERTIKTAWIVGLIYAAITLLGAFSSILMLIDVAIISALSIGIYKRSKACSIIMVLYTFSNIAYRVFQLMQPFGDVYAIGVVLNIVFLIFFFRGMRAIIVYNNLSQTSDNSENDKRPSVNMSLVANETKEEQIVSSNRNFDAGPYDESEERINPITKTIKEEPANKKIRSVNYIRKHWRGEFSLAVSFWINLVLLNFLKVLFEKLFSYNEIIENPVIVARVVIIYAVFCYIVVYPWQIVGLWRSCNHHIEKCGKRFWALTSQGFVIVGFILTIALLGKSWPIYKDYFRIGFQKDEWANYTLKLEKDNAFIHLQGGLGFGVSEEVGQLLKKYPEVKGIILDSSGGRIYEGRELADLISTYSLDTYSFEGCYSAATIAFISGKNRFLGIGANLAFHQYQVGYKSMDGFVDMKDEQANDLLIFQQQGIKSEFLDKLFITHQDEFWYPTVDEMLEAGVIHGIVNPSDLFPIEYSYTSEEIDEASLEVEEALLDIPLYKTIKRYDPETYRRVIVEAGELLKKGATLIEAQRAGANLLRPLAKTVMPKSSDEALIQFAQVVVYNLKKAKEIDPILGLKMLYPKQYGSVSFSKFLSDDERAPMLDALSKIIIDAYEENNPVVDTEAAELLMEKLSPIYEEYANYLELDSLQNTDDYERHCDFVIKAYTAILKEDKITAGNALRYMFSPE
ncbi:MAG: hypothetical protein FVQ84_03245 [Planctomycetes bacterium]|nr:hypothetical protein [Planctomycetota bacterium]